MIKPILLYGCEILGFGNLDLFERVQLKYLKYTINLKKSTPSFMVYGETGTYLISLDIQETIISFWTKLIPNNQEHYEKNVILNVFNHVYTK